MPTQEWRQRNKRRYREYQRVYFAKPGMKEKQSERARALHLRVKLEVFQHYSPELKCQSCGISDIRVLTIDHINGGGRAHIRGGGIMLYYWLRRSSYPPGFQVLCMNCQFVKRLENRECRRSIAEVWYAPKEAVS